MLALEEIRGENTAQIGTSCVQAKTNGSLRRSADIITVPGDTSGDIGINPARGEEGSSVLNMNVLCGDEHGKSNNGEQAEADHEYTALLELVGEKASANSEDTRDDVWWDSHELRFAVLVPHALDDRRQEQADAVQADKHAKSD